METTPDTVISLTTGQKFVVLESADEVIRRVIEFRREILAEARRARADDSCRETKAQEQTKAAGGTESGTEDRGSDLISVAGLVVALAGILGGLLLEGGKIKDIAQVTAALIVLGGTTGAVMVSTPLHGAQGALRRLAGVFLDSTPGPERR